MLRNAATPFATTSGIAIPTISVLGGERPGRRQEQSGSLPLDQMLSRNPSPIGSMPSGNSLPSLDRHYSDSMVSRQSSAQPSRLGSMADPSREEGTGHAQSSYGSLLDAASATAVANAAAFDSGIPPPPPRPLATVYSGQGLPPDSRKWSYDQEHSVSSLSAQDLAELQKEVLPGRDSESGAKSSRAADGGSGRSIAVRDDTSFKSSWSRGPSQAAEAEGAAQRRLEKQRQHPWLLYFYDRDLERDYSKYHAKQMTKVGCSVVQQAHHMQGANVYTATIYIYSNIYNSNSIHIHSMHIQQQQHRVAHI